ncbi:hypothetical protein D3C78_938820 [compost metagenome]
MTRRPLRFSLDTRFRLSVSSCSFLNLGRTSTIQTATITTSNATAAPVVRVHSQLLPEILSIAHTARMGAFTSSCKPITISICTCVMSFVERVIRLAVEKLLISSIEKDCTLSNNLERNLADKSAAILAAMPATTTEVARLPRAQSSIQPPATRISFISLPGVWISRVISLM